MTLVSNDPIWWPSINLYRISSYFVVASSAGLIYDWALTFGQEVELIWRQRWSLMTILYLSVRYIAIIYVVISILYGVPIISVGDAGCSIMHFARDLMNEIVGAILLVIIIARLHAMYQKSRKVLILLVVVGLAVAITEVVIFGIATRHISGEELILSGTYQCAVDYDGDSILLYSMIWMLAVVWEVLASCLAVWIAVKHFHELRRQSAGGIIGDCFTVLMKTHVAYFASVIAVFSLTIEFFSSTDPYSMESHIFSELSQSFLLFQLFVLGPRLILGVREYHDKIVANSDTATDMTSVVFQERVHVSTSSSV